MAGFAPAIVAAMGGIQPGGWVQISIFTGIICLIATVAALTAKETFKVPTGAWPAVGSRARRSTGSSAPPDGGPPLPGAGRRRRSNVAAVRGVKVLAPSTAARSNFTGSSSWS